MAILCSHCGKPLQKDDAHFCNNCGMLIPSHPFSPQSLSQSSQQQHPQSGSATPVEPGASSSYARPASMSGIAGNPVPETGNGPVRPAARLENQPAPQREQNGQLPPTRAGKDKPPEWMNHLGKNTISQSGLLEERPYTIQQTPAPALDTGAADPSSTNISKRGSFKGQRDAPPSPRENASPPASSLHTNPPQRELRVKVWENDDDAQTLVEQGKPAAKALPVTPQPIVSAWKDVDAFSINVPGGVAVPANDAALSQQNAPEMEEIENLPTSSLGAVSAEQIASADASTQTTSETQDIDDLPTRPLTAFPGEKPLARAEIPSLADEQQNATDDIEDLATLHLPAQASSASPTQQKPEYIVVRDNTPAPGPINRGAEQMQSQPGFAPPERTQMQSQPGFAPFDQSQTPMPTTTPPLANNGAPAQSSPQLTPDAAPKRRARKRVPFVIALVILVVLAAAGAGSWVVIAQPFTVAPITAPLVSFQDQSLGMAVQYPHDWTAKIDRSKSVIAFYDSGNTDRMNVQVTNASSADLAQYLQQQAAQQGLTAPKAGSALSFGGSTWQQLQGSVVLSGANYSEVFLASKHGTHLYTIAQLAPQISYADEEKVTFSPMRATWQFLS